MPIPTNVPARLVRRLQRIRHVAERIWAMITGRNFIEDYERVYPDGTAYDCAGRSRPASPQELHNYRNHRKFYEFLAQFAPGSRVIDVGCGSGYGAALLRDAGANHVTGVDLSEHALAYARMNYGQSVDFQRMSATALRGVAAGSFDLAVASEVLEHVQEFGQGRALLAELVRVVRPGGLVVVATPNAELHPLHGFTYRDLKQMVAHFWPDAVIFENALLPFGWRRRLWEDRLQTGDVGVIVSTAIDLSETALPAEESNIGLKAGLAPGVYQQGDITVDTTRLHNTHSFVVVTRNRA